MTTSRDIKRTLALAKSSACSTHPTATLSVRLLDGAPELWCVRCDGQPSGVASRPTLASAYKQGDAVPAATEPHLRRKYGRWIDRMTDETPRAVALREPDDKAITAALDIFEVSLPTIRQLSDPDKVKLTKLVTAYNLQPFHVHIQTYNENSRKPTTHALVITYEGRLFCAQQPNSLGASYVGVDFRPLSKDERELQDIPEGQAAYYGWVNVMMQGQVVQRARNIGRAGPGKDGPLNERDTDWRGQRNPIAMAHKQEQGILRCKRRALEEAAPLGVAISVMTPDGLIDDGDTDIIEGTVTEVPPAALPEPEVLDVSDGVDEAIPAAVYDWGEPDGAPKLQVIKGDGELGDTTDMLSKAGFDTEDKLAAFEFPTGATGTRGVVAAVKSGYRAPQILAAVQFYCGEREPDIEELPW